MQSGVLEKIGCAVRVKVCVMPTFSILVPVGGPSVWIQRYCEVEKLHWRVATRREDPPRPKRGCK